MARNYLSPTDLAALLALPRPHYSDADALPERDPAPDDDSPRPGESYEVFGGGDELTAAEAIHWRYMLGLWRDAADARRAGPSPTVALTSRR